jgi:AcrR family transcriptional regulator
MNVDGSTRPSSEPGLRPNQRPDARAILLEKVVAYAADGGIAGKSLREIAAGVGSSHRMLLYHFGSRESLMAAVVASIEARQRETMAGLATQATSAGDAMRAQWQQLTAPEVRPFVRLFFEVFGLAVQGTPGAAAMLDDLTGSWLREGVVVAKQHGYDIDATAIRLGVAVARGLLIDLLAGADPEEVSAAHARFVEMVERGL